MKLPNAQRAVVDIEKLTQYCLSQEHPRGKHKARVFGEALGLTAKEADRLRSALLSAASTDSAQPGEKDGYGERYVIDFKMKGPKKAVTIRSSWMVRKGEDFPRFISCYVL